MTISTVTTERLREIIAANDGMLNRGEASTIAEELLAVREAQPYGYLRENDGQVQISIGPERPPNRSGGYATPWGAIYAAPPALPANVIGRSATPDDSPYPATISGGCLLAQAWADGYNVRNAVTAAPAPAVPDAITADNAPAIFEIAAQVERIGLSGAYGAYASGWNACRTAMLAAAPTPTNQEVKVN